jgi:17beta-estradiol 17-dehydrogenase / very-long-chain 3-oxoacyl-CoA reductase
LTSDLEVITFAIGAFFVLRWLYRIARTIQQIKFGTKVTVERYGKGSWAVVTGCTDGIGKAFALELASRGFNLVLISRNIDKLNGTSKEV